MTQPTQSSRQVYGIGDTYSVYLFGGKVVINVLLLDTGVHSTLSDQVLDDGWILSMDPAFEIPEHRVSKVRDELSIRRIQRGTFPTGSLGPGGWVPCPCYVRRSGTVALDTLGSHELTSVPTSTLGQPSCHHPAMVVALTLSGTNLELQIHLRSNSPSSVLFAETLLLLTACANPPSALCCPCPPVRLGCLWRLLAPLTSPPHNPRTFVSTDRDIRSPRLSELGTVPSSV